MFSEVVVPSREACRIPESTRELFGDLSLQQFQQHGLGVFFVKISYPFRHAGQAWARLHTRRLLFFHIYTRTYWGHSGEEFHPGGRGGFIAHYKKTKTKTPFSMGEISKRVRRSVLTSWIAYTTQRKTDYDVVSKSKMVKANSGKCTFKTHADRDLHRDKSVLGVFCVVQLE